MKTLVMQKEAAGPFSKTTLNGIKSDISASWLYFKDNVDRFHTFRKYVFDTSINDDQKAVLQGQSKPVVEFNILEAYISRLLGEFSKHEPSIEVTPAEGNPVQPQVIELVEGYIRHVLYEANKNSMSYEVYKDLLSGGYSVIKCWTEYATPMSMKQIIRTGRVFDPTLCGFDPMARHSHKGDGRYSFELFPMTEEDFRRAHPDVDIGDLSYSRGFEEFNWSYKNDKDIKTIMVGDYYVKKHKRTRIVELADGSVIRFKEYEKFLQRWDEERRIEQPPVIVGKPRWTTLETVCRYKIIESTVLEYEETDYAYLPHIFVDGNSIILRQGTANVTYQMCRPYVYHGKGMQDLKNFGGQCLADYLEGMTRHKFIVKKEALPQEEDFLQALADMQHANTIVVNAFSENNPEQAIPEPIREVVNVPAPPEVMAAFQIADPTMQTILGSFASNLGKNDNDLSGKAVIETASIGNSAAMPYVTGYLQAWTQLGNVIVDLMPKYLKGKRELPIVSPNGQRTYQNINAPGMPLLDYEQNAIKVQIEAGVNFQVQKNQALQQISILMGVSQEFNHFMNSPIGLPILTKNLTIYGADELQAGVPQYLQMQQQQQQQAQQQQAQMMQQDPRMIKAQADMQKNQIEAQKVQFENQQQQFENQLAIASQATDKILADAKVMEAEAKITTGQIDAAVRMEEAETSLQTHALDHAAKIAEIHSREKDQQHTHLMDHHANVREHMKLQHDLSKPDAIKQPKEEM